MAIKMAGQTLKLTGILIFSVLIHTGLLFIPITQQASQDSVAQFTKGKVVTSIILRKKVTKVPVKVKKKKKSHLKDKTTENETSEKEAEEEQIVSNEVVGVEVGSVIEFRPVPSYPKISRIRGEVGKVGVTVKIDERGIVLNAKVIESSGHTRLDSAAKEASLKASFSPAMKNGMRVASDHIIYYKFELK